MLATRYDVEVFSSSTATTPVARSAVSTVYVTTEASAKFTQSCTGGICVVTATVTINVPASVIRTEMAKPVYPYFGYTLAAPGSTAPRPTSLQLGGGDPQVSAGQPVSATQYTFTVTHTFQAGSHHYHWAQDQCAKDSAAEDGIGLPASHDCGNSTVPYPPPYLG